jgi:uncharacterized SAM-binding protein YcdF (DUF218 family)
VSALLLGLCLAVMLVIAGAAGLAFLAYRIVRYATRSADGTADAAIVLGAAEWNGDPSPVFRERIQHGVELYLSGRVSHLIFTGGYGDGSEVSESAVGRDLAVGLGVDPEHVFIEEFSRSTQGNLVWAAEIVRAQGFRRVLIVSDPLHMHRSVAMARRLGLDADTSPTPSTRFRSPKSRRRFLHSELKSYVGYWLRGRRYRPREPQPPSAGEETAAVGAPIPAE